MFNEPLLYAGSLILRSLGIAVLTGIAMLGMLLTNMSIVSESGGEVNVPTGTAPSEKSMADNWSAGAPASANVPVPAPPASGSE